MLAVVLADTHLKASSTKRLPAPVYEQLTRADVVLHAGDVTDGSLLDEMAGYAPVHAVLGNNDVGVSLPSTLELELDGVRVAMIHDSGQRARRAERMKLAFPNAGIVVFGHSHIPWNEAGVDGQWLFNPGSPTQRRAQPHPTFGLLELDAGVIRRHEIVAVD